MNETENILLILGRLEGKVDALVTAVGAHEEHAEKLEARVRSLENSRAWLIGAAAVVAGTVSLIIKKVT
jgi:hypothetical protein